MFYACLLPFASVDADTGARHYTIDSAHTSVSFEVRAFGVGERGRFNTVAGTVMLDTDASTGELDIAIDARSLRARNRALERLIRGRSILDVQRYPEIHYHAARIVFLAGKPALIDGELTLRGITRSIPLKVTAYSCTSDEVQQQCTIAAQATLRRSEFGIARYESVAGDEMQLSINAEGILA
jgi:polyisoprenoid-binding protein YceI